MQVKMPILKSQSVIRAGARHRTAIIKTKDFYEKRRFLCYIIAVRYNFANQLKQFSIKIPLK